jgi:3-keto-5-aminohexanoate cleavage enzyme
MRNKVWLEVALNGPWGRALQPRAPMTVAELIADGVACANAGAAIIHLHTYDERTGLAHEDAELHARVIEGIRAQCDAIVYPTIELAQEPSTDRSQTAALRYAAVEALAARKLLEWAPVDPGSVNIAMYARLGREDSGMTYVNTSADIRTGLALCAKHALHPSYAIYEPGFLRLGAALAARTPNLRAPIYRLMLTEGLTFGLPPKEYALVTYRELLHEFAPGAPWMLAGYLIDPTPLIPSVIATGGHLRVGLEDAPLHSDRSNVQWVEHAIQAITNAGGEPASAADVRSVLAKPRALH